MRKHAVASSSTALACWSARVQSVSGIGLESNLNARLCAGSSNTSSALSTESSKTRYFQQRFPIPTRIRRKKSAGLDQGHLPFRHFHVSLGQLVDPDDFWPTAATASCSL